MAYFPNGTSGEVLDNQCCDCIHEDEWRFCPVYAIQTMYNYDQCNKGQEKLSEVMNMLVDEKGKCLVREAFFSDKSFGPVPCMDGLRDWAKKHKIEVK